LIDLVKLVSDKEIGRELANLGLFAPFEAICSLFAELKYEIFSFVSCLSSFVS
jgi:hypothetical protein